MRRRRKTFRRSRRVFSRGRRRRSYRRGGLRPTRIGYRM